MAINDFNLDDFRAHFVNAAREYLFFVYLNFPSGIGSTSINPRYLVRSTSFPGRSVGSIDVPWQGYNYSLGGKSTVEDGSCTFTVDKEAGLYNQFAAGIDKVHNIKTNEHGDPQDYMVDQRVDILKIDGSGTLKSVSLLGAGPTTLAPLNLDYSSDAALTFEVTFKYLRPSYDSDGQSSSG